LLDLAGNSFVANPFMAILISVLRFWPFKPEGAAEEAEGHDADALSSVSALLGV
jgi:hypothetical protein